MIRELGPLLTAFMVVGRSRTAFATELGDMSVARDVVRFGSWKFRSVDSSSCLAWPDALDDLLDVAAVLGVVLLNNLDWRGKRRRENPDQRSTRISPIGTHSDL